MNKPNNGIFENKEYAINVKIKKWLDYDLYEIFNCFKGKTIIRLKCREDQFYK